MVTLTELPPGKEYALLQVGEGGLYTLLLIGTAAHQEDDLQFSEIVSGFIAPETNLVMVVNEVDAPSFRTDVSTHLQAAATTTTTLPA